MLKYHSSRMTGGNVLGRVIGFVKELFSCAASHLSNALIKAQPHARPLPSKAMESATDLAVEKV